jgi:hypothetical protein
VDDEQQRPDAVRMLRGRDPCQEFAHRLVALVAVLRDDGDKQVDRGSHGASVIVCHW